MAAEKIKTGKVIKLSRELYGHLTSLKGKGEGYDAFLRKHFGLPAKNGHEQPLRSYFVIDTPTDLLVRRTLAEAKGEAILLAVKRGQKFRTDHYPKKDKVVCVRELP